MLKDFKRILRHALYFYKKRFTSIMLAFSVPMILAYVILLLVQLPTYPAIGAAFLKTGGLPDLSSTDVLIIGAALIIANFIVADAITNINLLIKQKRTVTEISSEVWAGLTRYATKIFYLSVIFFLILFLFQLLMFELTFQPVIYPLVVLLTSVIFFLAPPAVVIDNEDTLSAIAHSITLLSRSPVFYLTAIFLWGVLALLLLTITGLVVYALLPYPYPSHLLVLINTLFVYPFLVVLQTQIYMEKYPLAK